MTVASSTIQRWRIHIQGIVQGVGFRPFVYGQALQWGLGGFVLNDSLGVTIEVEGPLAQLEGFSRALQERTPLLARIDTMTRERLTVCDETKFSIAHSQPGNERKALISPDTATCADCLHELFDERDRRYLYPFINCTNCGPRFTIIQNVPYDRSQTTMSIFPMCETCQAEYDDPLSRRFHAQPNACPACGPQMRLLAKTGAAIASDTPIRAAAQQLAKGAILAIKGIGGYHLACDALHEDAVAQLRVRKHREAKPFALMVPDLATARQLCIVSDAEATLLQSYRRPIVLLRKKESADGQEGMTPDASPHIAESVAPVYDTLGIMLPYAPQHHLLLAAFAKIVGPDRPTVLVMTSGNVSDEPIAYRDEDAQQRLLGIADGMLTHNRDIHMRCDDSVMRIVAGGEQFLRRSRGFAPEPITLAFPCPVPILACGGHLKNTYCLGKEKQAFMSHHIGDLENMETLQSFGEGIPHFEDLFGIPPSVVAHDLHPEYLATKYALDMDVAHKIGIQHHHAHIASVLAEHGLSGPVIGVAADGTGYGTDGAIWGCEIMKADLHGFERLAHLTYVPLPGGEQAVRQPWRIAAAYLAQAYSDDFLDLDIPFVRDLDRKRWHTLSQMIARQVNAPLTSSLGRLFDAVAALLNIRSEVIYEGQAAIEMEILARTDTAHVYPFSIEDDKPTLLDVRPMIRAIVQDIQRGISIAHIAGNFHWTIAEMLATMCIRVRQHTGLHTVALSGGVFQNRLLLERLLSLLEQQVFQVYTNRRVPCNDGGLALGQLAIAAALVSKGE